MDVDEKIKELTEMFLKTGKELGELVKQNEKFVMDEIHRVEDAVRRTTEVALSVQRATSVLIVVNLT